LAIFVLEMVRLMIAAELAHRRLVQLKQNSLSFSVSAMLGMVVAKSEG
jgi:uncharacterized membrane protein